MRSDDAGGRSVGVIGVSCATSDSIAGAAAVGENGLVTGVDAVGVDGGIVGATAGDNVGGAEPRESMGS